tara:strand:+ start:6658 stop:6843 length:186 start_codon:yes stop_codon:yes gene_type:complete
MLGRDLHMFWGEIWALLGPRFLSLIAAGPLLTEVGTVRVRTRGEVIYPCPRTELGRIGFIF